MESAAKGAIVAGTVAAVRKLRKGGRVSAAQLAARLSGPALELLEQKIEIGRWYPMAAFAELVDLEWDLAGNRDPAYARESGARSAEIQFESGRYQQLDFAKRAGRADSRETLVRQSKLITTITSMFYSYLVVSVGIDPSRPNELQIVYENAAQFSEALRYSTEGFMNRINEIQGSPRKWTSERTAPDRIVYRLSLPERMQS